MHVFKLHNNSRPMRCRQVGSASHIWDAIYQFLRRESWFGTQPSGGNSPGNVSWPDTAAKLTQEHWAAINTLSHDMRDKWKTAVSTDTSAIELEALLGDDYKKALSDFAESGSLTPLLMDLFLQWFAQLAGVQYLDTDGIRSISDSVLQRAVATEALKTDFKRHSKMMKHVVMLCSAYSTTLATNRRSLPAADALSEKLKSLSCLLYTSDAADE